MKRVDAAIIGGGPAGMSAAHWCADLGLDTVLIERSDELGGQLANIFNPITNYLGVNAANGEVMRARFLDSIRDSKFERISDTEVSSIDAATTSLRLANGSEISSEAIVLATGVRRRRLGIPGETEFRGKGILESGARDRELMAGKRVLVVGGGDAAMENALLVSEFAAEVLVAFRRDEPTARSEFKRQITSKSNVRLIAKTVIKRISGDGHLEVVEIEDLATGQQNNISIDHLLIRIGFEPNSDLVRGIVELDAAGYVRVDANGRTNRDGIFAVGDVANPTSPTISTAVGTGATAAKHALEFIGKAR